MFGFLCNKLIRFATNSFVEGKVLREKKGLLVLVALLLIVVGVCVYQFAVDPLLRFERLEIYSFWGWTSNSEGEVKQVSFHLFNNGTKELTIREVWVNGTLLKQEEWGCYDSPFMASNTGEWFFIAPRDLVFDRGKHYNLTIGTASGNSFPFIMSVEDESVKPENLTFVDYDFGWLPSDYRYIALRFKNLGETPAIVTRVRVGAETFDMREWLSANTLNAIILDYYWGGGTYIIQVETAVGNKHEIIATNLP